MNQRIRNIMGVEFESVRKLSPAPHWIYRVGGKDGPQGYPTRPKMWDDLERFAKARGFEQWKKDWSRFTS